MQLHCHSCKATIDAGDVNLQRLVAKCRACNAVFSFQAPGATIAPFRGGLPERPPVPLPEQLSYEASDARLAIRRRWFTLAHFGLLFFCIAWDSFLVFWYGSLTQARGEGAWLAAVFPIAHVAVGVGLTYSTLAGLLNTTTITVEDGWLTVRHGPIPWRGNRKIPVGEVTQLFCERHVRRGSDDDVSSSYSVSALRGPHEKITLVKNLPALDQALFIEYAIEERLGLVDMHVPGAVTAA